MNRSGFYAAARAALGAVALELVKTVPVVGVYLSAGTKAYREKLQKLAESNRKLDPDAVLDWMARLPPADYERLVREAIEGQPGAQNSAEKDLVAEAFIRTKPTLESIVDELKS